MANLNDIKRAHVEVIVAMRRLCAEWIPLIAVVERDLKAMDYPQLMEVHSLSKAIEEDVKVLWHVFLGLELDTIREMNKPETKRTKPISFGSPQPAKQGMSKEQAQQTLAKAGISTEMLAKLLNIK